MERIGTVRTMKNMPVTVPQRIRVRKASNKGAKPEPDEADSVVATGDMSACAVENYRADVGTSIGRKPDDTQVRAV